MTPAVFEQRNRYKGTPPRPWVRLRFRASDGSTQEMELVADTGNPCAVILSRAKMSQLQHLRGPILNTNFGPLGGGWLRLALPEVGLVQDLLGYASDTVVSATQLSSLDFEGLAGLPLLQLVEYGGDANWFWLRPAPSLPSKQVTP